MEQPNLKTRERVMQPKKGEGNGREAVLREASLLLVTERIEEHVDQRDRER